MRTLKFALILLLLPLLAGAQAGMTLRTARIIEEQKAAATTPGSPLLRSAAAAEERVVSALLSTSKNIDIQDITNTGAKIGTALDGVVTVRATPSQLGKIAQVKGVSFIAADNRAYPKLDKALPMVKVDSAHAGAGGLPQAYTGKDVIVGIVDIGFNYTHPNFYDSLGNLRIVRVWDQSESGRGSCAHNTYGNVYTAAELIEKKICSSSVESHGTHVAGIAAGGGGAVKTYGGVAPDANLVLVQVGDGADSEIIDGINYIFSYAQSVGKPAVVNLSLGYHFGPHDGTSAMDRAIDQLSGEGRIVVGAAGNEGYIKLHASHTFASATDTMRTVIGAVSTGEAEAMAWMDKRQQAQWNVELWSKTTKTRLNSLNGSFYSTGRNSEIVNKVLLAQGGDTIKVTAGGYSGYWEGDNRGVIMVLAYNNKPDNYAVVIAIKASTNNHVHLWNIGNTNDDVAPELTSLNLNSSWVDGDTECTVGEIGGTAKSIISVGAYVSRSEWQLHSEEVVSYREEQNSMASFSSLGPTADGRTKPDLIAPGSALISSVNTCDERFGYSTFFNSYSDLTIDKEPSGAFYYAALQGTSMASPVVTGAVALLLQECPTLTPDSVRSILQRTAYLDAYTASLSPNTRGAGMLDVLGALKATQGKECGTVEVVPFDNECTVVTSVANNYWEEAKNQLEFSVMPNPNTGVFSIKTEESGTLTLSVFDLGGTLLYRLQVQAESEMSLQYLPQGVYLVQLSKEGKQGAKKMLIRR